MDINYLMLYYCCDPNLCLCGRLLGRAQFKPWGVKKNSAPYVTEIVLSNVWFNVGLFTLIKMDSLMVLPCPWSSLLMMLKLVSVMLCPVCCTCTWIGEGCLGCSLHLSPRVLAVSLCIPHCRLCDCIGNCR